MPQAKVLTNSFSVTMTQLEGLRIVRCIEHRGKQRIIYYELFY